MKRLAAGSLIALLALSATPGAAQRVALPPAVVELERWPVIVPPLPFWQALLPATELSDVGVLRDLDAALPAARRVADQEAVGRVHLALSYRAYRFGDSLSATIHALRAYEGALVRRDVEAALRARSLLGLVATPRCRDPSREDRDEAALLLMSLFGDLTGTGDPDELERVSAGYREVQVALPHGDRDLETWAFLLDGYQLHCVGEYERAGATWRTIAEDPAAEAELRGLAWLGHAAALLDGPRSRGEPVPRDVLSDARKALHQAERALEEAGIPEAEPQVALLEARAHRFAGDFKAAGRRLDSARDGFARAGSSAGLRRVALERVTMALAAGETEEAEAQIAELRTTLAADSSPEALPQRFGAPLPDPVLERFLERTGECPEFAGRPDGRPLHERLAAARRLYRWARATGDPLIEVVAISELIRRLEEGRYFEDLAVYRALRSQIYQEYRVSVPLRHRLLRAGLIDLRLFETIPREHPLLNTELSKPFDSLSELIAEAADLQRELLDETMGPGFEIEGIDEALEASWTEVRRIFEELGVAIQRFGEAIDRGDRRVAVRHFAEAQRSLQRFQRLANASLSVLVLEASGTQQAQAEADGEVHTGEFDYDLVGEYLVGKVDLTEAELFHLEQVEDYRRNVLAAGLLNDREMLSRAVVEMESFYDLYSQFQPPPGLDLPIALELGDELRPDELLAEPAAEENRDSMLDTAIDRHFDHYLDGLVGRQWSWYRADVMSQYLALGDMAFLQEHYGLGRTPVEVLVDQVESSEDGSRFQLTHRFRLDLALEDDSSLLEPPSPRERLDPRRAARSLERLADPWSGAGAESFEALFEGVLSGRYLEGPGMFLDPGDLTSVFGAYHGVLIAGQLALGVNGEGDFLPFARGIGFQDLSEGLDEAPELAGWLRSLAQAKLDSEAAEARGEEFSAELLAQVMNRMMDVTSDLSATDDEGESNRDLIESTIGYPRQYLGALQTLDHPELLFRLVGDTESVDRAAEIVAERHRTRGEASPGGLSRRSPGLDVDLALHHVMTGSYREAVDEIDRALATERAARDPAVAYQLHYLAGLCLRRLGAPEALERLERSVEEIDRVRASLRTRQLAAAVGAARRMVYEEAIRGLLDAGREEDLATAVARFKRPTLIPAAALSGSEPIASSTRGLLDRTILTFGVLSESGAAWRSRVLDYSSFFGELFRDLGGEAGEAGGAPIPESVNPRRALLSTLDALANVLAAEVPVRSLADRPPGPGVSIPEGMLLVSYFVGSEGVYRVTRDWLGAVRASFQPVPEERLVEWVAEARRTIADREQPGEAIHRLYGVLIEGVEGLDGSERLLLWPDGALSHLPFQALRKAAGQPYLIQSHVVSFGHGGYGVPTPDPRAEGTGRLLVLADPGGDLPEARREAEAIAAVEGLDVGRPLIGREATAANLAARLGEAEYLHLATHARFSPDQPNFSHLLLADGDRLYSLDLGGLSFAGKQVFLSACETRLGQLLPGDDPYGIADALIASGASSVVATLWRVESESAGLFSAEYYRRHRESGDSAETLASVARDFINGEIWGEGGAPASLEAPFYWAPYVHLTPVD